MGSKFEDLVFCKGALCFWAWTPRQTSISSI